MSEAPIRGTHCVPDEAGNCALAVTGYWRCFTAPAACHSLKREQAERIVEQRRSRDDTSPTGNGNG